MALRTGTGAVTYLHADPVDSVVMSTEGSTVTASRQYRAYGLKRGGNDYAFEPNYTGQRLDDTGLLYYNARYYDPQLGAFISPDTLIPDPTHYPAYNRYLYANGNPLKYNDPTGHQASCMLGADGSWDCNGNAVIGAKTVQVGDQLPSCTGDSCNDPWSLPKLLGGMLAGSMAAAIAPVAAPAAMEALASACAGSGTCQNAWRIVTHPNQGVWRMDPFARGREIEQYLGRSPQLAENFRVIDRFENGAATSIKSINLASPTYQNTQNLDRTVQGYINKLANWQGQPTPWKGVTIQPFEITRKVLELAVPSGATQEQASLLQKLQQSAQTVGVHLDIVVVK